MSFILFHFDSIDIFSILSKMHDLKTKWNSDREMKKVCIKFRRFPRTLCKFSGQKVTQFRQKWFKFTPAIQFFERKKLTCMCLVFNSISPNCNDVYWVLKIDLLNVLPKGKLCKKKEYYLKLQKLSIEWWNRQSFKVIAHLW